MEEINQITEKVRSEGLLWPRFETLSSRIQVSNSTVSADMLVESSPVLCFVLINFVPSGSITIKLA